MRWFFVLLIAAVLPCAADDTLMQRYVPALSDTDALQALRIAPAGSTHGAGGARMRSAGS